MPRLVKYFLYLSGIFAWLNFYFLYQTQSFYNNDGVDNVDIAKKRSSSGGVGKAKVNANANVNVKEISQIVAEPKSFDSVTSDYNNAGREANIPSTSSGAFITSDAIQDIEYKRADDTNANDEATSNEANEENQKDAVTPAVATMMVNTTTTYNAEEYQKQLDETLKPLNNALTTSFFQQLWAGLCNQYMQFIGVIFVAQSENQAVEIIEESIQWKDTFGYEEYIQHHQLFDVVHWNSFYPSLPRFARYEKEMHPHIKTRGTKVKIDGKWYPKGTFVQWNVTGDAFEVATNPKPIGSNKQQVFNRYKQFSKKLDAGEAMKESPEQYETFKLIMQGAFRPHPEIQGMIDQFVMGLGGRREEGEAEGKGGFMVLHARIEPDMIVHPMCKVRYMDACLPIITSDRLTHTHTFSTTRYAG